jgi:carbon-monoxide dehydrogenase small subunit
MNVTVIVNGERIAADIPPRTSLADFLRGTCGLTGTHLGCEHGVCGACTVMIDSRPMRSCITYAVQCEGSDVRTIEGFDEEPLMAALRGEFSRQHALQCGFCTPGMLITAHDIVSRLGDPGEPRVRQELAGNLCRCTGYVGIVNAVRNVGATTVRHPPTPAPVQTVLTPTITPTPPGKAPVEAFAMAPTLQTGATAIAQSFTVAAGIDRVWEFFHDLSAVSACIPGVELLSHDEANFTGRIALRVGPIRATVEGAGVYALDDQGHVGKLEGSGQDKLSGSRVRGALEFRLTGSSQGSARVDTVLRFTVQGMLAQFSRSSLAMEFTARILNEFARRASAALTGAPTVEQPASSSGLGLLSLLRWWLTSRFRRRPKQ